MFPCCTFTVMETFADRLAAALKKLGWSQNRLEREAGLSKGHVNRLIHGKGARTAPETLVAIARVLGVDHDWLATGSGQMGARAHGAADSPPPPPISETRTALDAIKDMIDAAYDPERHLPSDAMLVSEGLLVGAPLLKANVDPATYVRRLLDTAAKERQRGRKPRGEDLPALAVGLLSDELDESREEVQRMNEMLAQTRQWMIDNGIPLPKTGQLAALPPVGAEPPRQPKKPARSR